MGAVGEGFATKTTARQAKKRLLRAIRKETKPPKGFAQWVLTLERRRPSENLGLLLVEAEQGGKLEWSGSMSVSLPEAKKYAPDGSPLPGEWDNIAIGESGFNVFTLELRGKTVIESVKGWVKRSFEDGKVQDFLSFVR